jgi:hypothetical protein
MEAYGGKKLREGAAGALESSRVESLGGWDAACGSCVVSPSPPSSR